LLDEPQLAAWVASEPFARPTLVCGQREVRGRPSQTPRGYQARKPTKAAKAAATKLLNRDQCDKLISGFAFLTVVAQMPR